MGAGVLDQLRLGSAASFPGIDPRVWVRYAVIEAVKIDARGAKADVLMLPTGEPETVHLGGMLAPRAGCYVPVEIGQMVVVIVPMGDANHGAVAIGAVYDQGQPAPEIVTANPEDAALVGRTDRQVRVVAQGTGRAEVMAQGNGNVVAKAYGDGDVLANTLGSGLVRLGLEAGGRAAAGVGDTVTVTIPIGTIMVENTTPPFMPPIIPNPGPITLSGVITSGSPKVRLL